MSFSIKKASVFILLPAKAITAISTPNAHIVATSWGSPRVDVFGIAPDKSIWHKYDIGSPGEGEYSERLEGNFSSGLAVTSWTPNRLDIVGRSQTNTYLHKAWTGAAWYPSITEWEDFGGNFSSAPASVSWGPNRLDIFGIDAEIGSVKHKYWNGGSWFPSLDGWEDLGGGPFIGDLTISSWGANRFDVWAAGKEDGELNHLFWDGSAYPGWEKLGGKFKTAPAVAHWDVDKIDIFGLFDGEGGDTKYHSKAYAGGNWYPKDKEWYERGGDFAGQPALVVNKGTNFLYVLGVAVDGGLKLQIWDGASQLPKGDEYWDLGDTQKLYPSSSSGTKEWTEQLDL
ncbi:hypothetical protein FKW77_007812 [Venturia effusa]|uniref:PLL-like beta propeller domain-containing protein n=1 Tax=Venturia effusa TaxID=50376 RepID=A0A517KWV7_9PEZI|nr:hypothetical protein FKW77_007812 [Venturia effusa]